MTKKLNVAKAAVAAAAILISGTAVAQEIKLGFNGDLSASPSAQSGQAAVLGIRAAIEDVNAAGGVLGREPHPGGPRRPFAAPEVDPEHERPDRQ